MDILWKLFPHAKFLHIVRDSRDVALSLGNASWGSRHIPTLALQWKQKVELAHKMGEFIGENYSEFRYEDLIPNIEKTLQKVSEFLEETYSPLMLEDYKTATCEIPKECLVWHRSSVSRINREKAFKWKSTTSRADQIIYNYIADKALRHFRYEVPFLSENI